MDFTELTAAHAQYREKMLQLNKQLRAKQTAEAKLLEKEQEIRKREFPRLTSGEITNALFKEILANEIFAEKVEHKKSITMTQLAQNEVSATLENLNLKKRLQDV